MQACGCDASGMVMERINQAQEAASEKLSSVKDSFKEIADGQSGEISIEPVKKALSDQLDNFKEYASDPSKLFSGIPCACCLPLGEIAELFREIADAFNEIVEVFTKGALDTIMAIVNAIITGLQGLVDMLVTAFESLGEVSSLTTEISNALSGSGDAQTALQNLESFRNKAKLSATGDKLEEVLGKVNELGKSPALQEVLEVVKKMGLFIAETPGKMRDSAKNIACGLGASAMAGPIDALDQIDGMFNAQAIEKMFTFASTNKGVAPSYYSGPLKSLDKSLDFAASALKAKA